MDHLISIMIHQCTLPSPALQLAQKRATRPVVPCVLCNPDSTLSTDVTFVVLALEMSMSTKADTFRQKPTLFRLSSVSAGCVLHFSTVSSFSRLLLPSHFSLNLFLTSPLPAALTLSLKRRDFFFVLRATHFPLLHKHATNITADFAAF